MPEESERVTRKNRIDPLLKAAGWTIISYNPSIPLTSSHHCAITEYPTDNGPADYALVSSGRIIALVEAKKVSSNPQEVLTQDERYARGLSANPFNFNGIRVPFLYATNGVQIWFRDARSPFNYSHQVEKFSSPQILESYLQPVDQAALERLKGISNNNPKLRPYQRESNDAMEAAIGRGQRNMLVAMATGTGKTLLMVNEIFRLMEAGVAKRVLFLVDRRALAAQAVRTFASFEAKPGLKFDKIYEVYSQRFFADDLDDDVKYDPKVLPSKYLTNPQPGHAFVYVCTIQRMTINVLGRNAIFATGDEEIDEDAEPIFIPPHAFDLIVADECHRGYTSQEQQVWRQTLDHFSGFKIGLTATPAAHTSAYFGQPVFNYGYERAVREGFLVDYDPVAISSNVRMNGIFLHSGEQVQLVDADTGAKSYDLLEDERQFDTQEIERKVTSPDSNRKILLEIKRYADEHEKQYGRFPKTLIFAVNDLPHTSHADQLVAQAREIFGREEAFVRKITGKVDRPLQRIREFRNRRLPGIVVTVDLLSTGVDIPDLEFIVFLRPVKSRILFEQMMGRGTRRGELYPDKSHFVVFDCFGGTLLEYFSRTTGITEQPPQTEIRPVAEVIEDVWQNRDRDYNIQVLVKRFQRIDKEMSGEARDAFSRYVERGDMRRFAVQLPYRLRDDFTGTMQILRSPGFLKLLTEYKRAPRNFVVAEGTQDDVSSRWLIRDSAGHEYKPEDYLTAFSRFVRENPDHIEAIRILLDRPKEWDTKALKELRQKLAMTTQRFTIENLQKAHQLRYHKALIDIISMVKHAAREDEPLFTAEERVERAFERITAGHEFSSDQQQWLDRIRLHLIQNLSITQGDFDAIPVFADRGGWRRADSVFGGSLAGFIQKFNEEIAV
jgi:type I restriction enzyme R subunit